MSDEILEFPWCPECRRNAGEHKCVSCVEGRTAHGSVQCIACDGVVDLPAWLVGPG